MFDNLFKPITINGMILKNRIVATPTGDDYEEKAMGGAALVIAGHAIVEPGRSSFASGDEPWIFSKYEREKTRERILKIHKGGAKASIEIFHGGAEARVKDYAVGPCSYVRKKDGVQVKGMSEEDMEETLKWYAETAASARKLGFDSIFLHFGHGWLPAQFLSPYYNKRSDEYGGSIENRAKFPLRILETVRNAVGNNYPIDMRISAYEWVENSISFEDVLAFLKMAEKYIDTVQISAGMDLVFEANVHCITTNLEEEMPNLKYAIEAKKQLNIPVSVVSAVLSAEMADEIIGKGYVDMVACGRTLLADPYWPRKAMENKGEDIVPCLRCSNCYHISTDHWNVGCSVNPRYHHQHFIPLKIEKAEETKNVVIIGAGPAGMKAAITAYDRGHKVTLIEKSDSLGGLLKVIEKEHHKIEIARLLKYYRAQIEKRDILVQLNTEATPDYVRTLNPDALLIAIGAQERILPIPGVDNPKVVLATKAILDPSQLGNKIAILGGGSIGCEIALELAEEGKEVHILEMTNILAGNANSLYREALRQKFLLHDNIHSHLNAACKEIKEEEILYLDKDGKQQAIPYDNLILSTGLVPQIKETESFYGICRNTVAIGDCIKPSSIMNANYEAYVNALNI
ncbi:MAG: NAD(P)/FAD-dependent oxidoreductase [Bacillota bacterium]|nr:NAD(P)/FAD-dependent oxidoreductase [Bacillota bacterium]